MQLVVDFMPVIVFFVAYKLFGMYVATAAIMVTMSVQIAVQWFTKRRVNKMLLISGILVLVFGGITIALRNPLFIQWKPTIVNWLFAVAFLGSRFVGDKTLIQRMMEQAIALPAAMWRQLNWLWVGNFSFLGAANIYVVYHYSEEFWVNFKLYGMLGLTLLMALIQGIWIARNMPEQEQHES
jgi:intracellular septation protein